MTLTKFRFRDLSRRSLKGRCGPLNIAKASSRHRTSLRMKMSYLAPMVRCSKERDVLADGSVHLRRRRLVHRTPSLGTSGGGFLALEVELKPIK